MTGGIKIRLYVADALAAGVRVALDEAKSHYLATVMRKVAGERVALFNGRHGEWAAVIVEARRGRVDLALEEQLRPQAPEPDLWLCFAPIKRARIDFVGEKATELGVSALQPIFTRRTAVERVNLERLAANAVEAAESCHRLTVPETRAPIALDRLLADWPKDRRLVFCDETGRGAPLTQALAGRGDAPAALLIGPEGGFAPEEQAMIRSVDQAIAVDLGPRLMRADTAALAALAAFQAVAGDWRAAVAKSLAMS
jgi:16S rRNA (uracil1498-N3)-methyltransferase